MPFYEPWHRTDADYFEVEHGENFSYPLHVHRCYEVVLLLEGEMTLTIDGKRTLLRQDEAAVIFPNQVHSLETPTHSRHQLFIFAPEMIAAFDRRYTPALPADPKISLAGSPLLPLLHALGRGDNLYAAKGVFYCLCAVAEEQLTFTSGGAAHSGNVPLLREILNFIQTNYADDCSLSSLAAAIKYDMTYLSKFFSANVGISFTAYVNQVRMAHACYLLRNTEDSIIAISHACGNASLRTFNRNFLTYTGMTPSEYRTNK